MSHAIKKQQYRQTFLPQMPTRAMFCSPACCVLILSRRYNYDTNHTKIPA